MNFSLISIREMHGRYTIVPWMVWVFFLGFSVKDHVVGEDDP